MMKDSSKVAQEIYPHYDALWPLVTMGVLTSDHKPNGWDPSSLIERKTRVAVIDTSVAFDHPNLSDAINKELAFDLFSTRLGSFPCLSADQRLDKLTLNTKTGVVTDLPLCTELLAMLIDRLSPGSSSRDGNIQPAATAPFSAHGTAICGLIGARPALLPIAEGYDNADPTVTEYPLPFCGVDPRCEIVPISTNFDPDPEMMILAFLYAELIGADIIVLPRVISDPNRTIPELNRHNIDEKPLGDLVEPVPVEQPRHKLWDELAQLIINISIARPVVCAAGNANEEFGIYPANMADEHNGIISVGAVNAKGYQSAFSNSQNLTIAGPSDDAQSFDRMEIRLDTQRHSYDGMGVPDINDNHKYSAFDVISTDVPGIFGYSASPYLSEEPEHGLREFGSCFCRFGGTSAASAFIAGFLSLGRSTGVLDPEPDGLAYKSWLLSKAVILTDGDQSVRFPAWDGSPKFPDKQ